jgi:hypothetical protein
VDFDPMELKNALVPVLRVRTPTDGPQDAWPETLLAQCRAALAVVLPLAPKEREFLDALLDRGEIVPSLLTSDAALADRIRRHPGLQWKALNVREFRKRSP